MTSIVMENDFSHSDYRNTYSLQIIISFESRQGYKKGEIFSLKMDTWELC